jgi:hypothetical protein
VLRADLQNVLLVRLGVRLAFTLLLGLGGWLLGLVGLGRLGFV